MSLLITQALWAAPTSVPLSDPVYAFLERMETLGYLSNVHDGIKPFSRNTVSAHLQKLMPQRDKLTPIDRQRLDDLLLDYRRELQPQSRYHLLPASQNWYSVLGSWDNFTSDFARYFRRNQPEEEDHLLSYESTDETFYADYEQGLTYERRSDEVYRSASWQALQLRGVLGANFGYRFKTELHGLRGDEPYVFGHPILKGSWSEKNDPGPRYSDRTGGELSWQGAYLDFRFAQQEVSWGYGESGKLILSNNAEQFPYISLSRDWGWVTYIALHGKLQSFPQDTLSDGQKLYPDKWLAGHRLEISPWRWVTLGLNETFIYGNRYADWAYLIPFNFYRAVQHKLRDRDNATISVDMELLPVNGVKLYGTLFFDEFRQAKIGTNWFGNKQAWQGGLYWVDPFSLPNLSLRAEYTAVMPWVYTHKYRINSYTSDYQSLGFWAGPNSEVLYLALQKEWTQRLSTKLSFRQYKHGANYPNENIGGDILVGHGTLLGSQTEARQTRKFLEGLLTTEKRYSGEAMYEAFNDMFFTLRYHLIDTQTEAVHKNLQEWYLGILFKY